MIINITRIRRCHVPFTLINYNRQSAQQKICFTLCCSLFGQRRQDKEVQKTEPKVISAQYNIGRMNLTIFVGDGQPEGNRYQD